MSESANPALVPFASTDVEEALGSPRFLTLVRHTKRVSLGAAGPMAVAAANFLVAMVAWGSADAAEFGLFSFMLLLVQLSFGFSNALVGTPLSVPSEGIDAAENRQVCLSIHVIYLLVCGATVYAISTLAGAGKSGALYAAFAMAANVRWCARSLALAEERVPAATASDLLYALLLGLTIGGLALVNSLALDDLLLALIGAHIMASALIGGFWRFQIAAIRLSSLMTYRRMIWASQARWSLVGVVMTEASSNAHAYVITILLGPAAFAPIAFASLFCRPVSVFLAALAQIERPAFVRHLRQGDPAALRKLFRLSLVGAAVAWAGNALLAATALGFAQSAIVQKGYDVALVLQAVLLWFVIMGARTLRTPFGTFLQAAGEFKDLARFSFMGALLSVTAVITLARFGAASSLLGIILGEALLCLLIVQSAVRKKY